MAPNLSTLRPLIVGDVIIDAKPVVHIVYKQFKAIHCDNCLQLSTSLKKCSKCQQTFYCDKNCQRIDWKYHKNECKVFCHPKFKIKGTKWAERLLLRLWLTIKSDESFVTKNYRLIDGTNMCLKDIHFNTKRLSEDMDYMIDFKLITNHFEEYGLDFNRKELLHWFGIVVCTAISCDIEWFAAEPSDDYPALIGSGLYPDIYTVGHSCLQNSEIIRNGLSLQLRAMKPIAVGTDITRSYVCLAQNKTDRQNELKKHYLIDCNCLKCERNLDSNIDYIFYKFFSSFVDQYLEECLRALTPVNWHQLVLMFEQIYVMGRQIYGSHHPDICLVLQKELVIRQMSKDLTLRPHQKFNVKVEQNLAICYGVDHPFYKIHANGSHLLYPYFGYYNSRVSHNTWFLNQ